MTEHQYKVGNQRIDFFSDGTFKVTEMPSAWLAGIIDSNKPAFCGSGTWEMVQDGDTWEMALTFLPPISGQSPTTYNAPWIPAMGLIYFRVPAETKEASYERCGPTKMRLSDPAMDPYREVVQAVDRRRLGFTPIPDDAWVEIQPGGGPQAWINVYGDTSRTIALKEVQGGYEWIYEQETAYGPDEWADYDGGTWQESISIDYQKEEVNGMPLNWPVAVYTGRDPRINNLGPLWLTPEAVRPFLDEWRVWRQQQPPDPIDLCP